MGRGCGPVGCCGAYVGGVLERRENRRDVEGEVEVMYIAGG